VLTIDPARPRASAVAVLNDQILLVGDDADARAEAGPRTRVIDLGGRTLLPGLNDNHCHPMGYGFALGWVDASPSAVAALDDLLARFRAAAAETPPGAWVLGRGYDDTRLDVQRHPTRHDLDRAVPDRPAMLIRTCGHIAVVNSAALRLAGITRETPDPAGGEIDRDASGEPTGILRERAQDLVRKVIPEATVDDIKRALVAAGRKFLSLGITSVGDAGIRKPEELRAYQELRREGQLPVRTFLMMIIDDTLDPIERLGLTTGLGDEWLRIGPAKLLQDGSGGGRTAAMTEPYPGEPDNYGIAVYTQEQLDDAFRRVAAAGLQGAAHAIGDRAIDMVLTAYERALALHPQPDPRWRIEHCGLLRPDLLERMRRLNVIAVPQPSFVYYLGDSYIRNFSEERLALAYPCRAWLDMGITAIGSSDAPVVPADPWINIRSAVTRLTQDGQRMGPEQAVTVDEALRMFTVNGAYGSFEEHLKGTITPGKLADLIVVDRDPREVPPEELHTVRVDLTMIDGRVAYER
ncbi:MAG: amidohydrolase, partial [Thermomicrobiaceae bacterium]|nr:amidohydrolase [Thermomicrobiaceae bacterium]